METRICKIEEINPAEYNPRIALKPGDADFEALKNSIEKFGTVAPLVINKTTGNLVSGHQRLSVLKDLGVEETEVVLIEVDEDQEKLLNVALNKIDGEWDFEKLEALFAEFTDDEIKFTGYSETELDGLFNKEASDPTFNYEDDSEEETGSDTSESGSSDKQEEKEKPEKEFSIFFSFPTKEAAEKWLEDKGQDHKFEGTLHNITIRMEGADFGTGNTD